MRDPKKDLEFCQKVTPGPWYWDGKVLRGQDNFPVMSAVSIFDKEKGDFTAVLDILEEDMRFIAEARTALPYWINKAIELEKQLQSDKQNGEDKNRQTRIIYRITIPGRPVPAARMTQRGKFIKPEALRYLEYKEKVGLFAKASGIPKIEGEIAVECKFFLKGGKLPDVDNLLKAVMDGLNGVAWKDDRQVVKISAERIEDECERVEVQIMQK